MTRRDLRTSFALATLCLLAVGCKTGVLPDPNDPNDVSALQPDVLMNNLKAASATLNEHKEKGEIDDTQYARFMADYARDLLSSVRLEAVPPDKYWKYAEVYRTAQLWPEAEAWFRRAVKAAKDEDRRVNDSLRLAQCLAHLNKVPEAIQIARSTFSTPPGAKAPILTAVLLEIVPAARGKGHDADLAKLLEDAIDQAEQTTVDPKTEPGALYLVARPFHVHHAWETIAGLYHGIGADDLAAKAMAKARQVRRTVAL